MSIPCSSPISIRHGTSESLDGADGSQGDSPGFSRMKSLRLPRTRSNSISPNLASPTPPTFVPDGSHHASRIGTYLLVEHVEGHNSGNVFRAVNFNTEEEFICKVYDRSEYRKAIDGYYRVGCHPNINNVVDLVIGSTKAYCFLNPGVAMKGVNENNSFSTTGFKAENLHSLVRSKQRLPEAVAAPLFAQAVAAVAHCHQNNIVLRDLKLRKFIFRDEERTQLMLESLDDACILESDNDYMVDRHGCPAYASPEILSCSAAAANATGADKSSRYSGKSSDVWSLGVMLYTLLVGRYPFHEPEPIAMFSKISRGQFTLPDSLSSESRDLVRNLLRRQPSERLAAKDALDHPWLKRRGICWDAPRSVMPLGAGGDRRTLDRTYMQQFGRYHSGHSFPSSLFSEPSYEDQMVPETVPEDTSDEMLFEFGE